MNEGKHMSQIIPTYGLFSNFGLDILPAVHIKKWNQLDRLYELD